MYIIRKALSDFETVFAEEMKEAATYFVPRRGIFWTPALVDTADEAFPGISPKGSSRIGNKGSVNATATTALKYVGRLNGRWR